MEIIVAVLLFFGGFTLGSISTDKGDEKSEPTMVVPEVVSVPGPHPATQITRHIDPTRCHFDKSVVYRDLTVPLRGQIDRPGTGDSDCEISRNCSNHSTASPRSTEVKYPHE
jgi:hypothetical protein